MPSLVQDAVDEVEYATGAVTTTWGAKRAADGHPAPFAIDYVEIGNEDEFDPTKSYPSRYAQFYDALHAKYPSLKFIATTTQTTRPQDLIDDHYYQSPSWFEASSHHYDTVSRSGSGVFVGEFASQEGAPTPNLHSALGDAAWQQGLMRNGDLVKRVSYAPLLVNVNDVTWKTNMIGFNGTSSYNSPSYYVQQMLATLHGPTVVSNTTLAPQGLQVLTTKNGNTTYVSVVNTASVATTAQLNLTGANPTKGTATTLGNSSITATNTLTDPTAVVPVTGTVSGVSNSFRYTFTPNSLTILQLR
jgi:alpha-L-arabinofuranosidase